MNMGFLCLFLDQQELKKISSVMPFTFNAVELCVVTLNERPWTRVKEVCRALKYSKKTADIVKNHCSQEHFAQKYQMSGVPTAVTPVDWPKDSNKSSAFTSMKKKCMSFCFQVNSLRQRILGGIVVT